MALLSSMPETPPSLAPADAGAMPVQPSWLRTALFGSVRDLTTALDNGLDPNSKTAGGTTLLMAAALDEQKTQSLLQRKADARTRGLAGTDALTIAASHVGSPQSVLALLDAGAEPEPSESVRVRRTPVVAASMAGDVETLKLLLSRGAKPSAEAVSEAVTFGHADILRTLINAGGDAQGVNNSGVNLLHWATITNRSTVIPILAAAHVPIDAIDDYGFTPLMYAATVEEDDTDTLRALLVAGADIRVRNDDGRTPLQQAQRLKHSGAVGVLRQHPSNP
jgi:ankyrin repeat protein